MARTRCLVLGVGKMGSAHLQALAALCPGALAGWAPSCAHRASVTAAGADFLGGSLESALRAFQPTHVIVATPAQTLTPTALTVLAAGVRHVLVEKPVALSVGEGRRLAAAAAALGATVRAGYNRRFYTSVRAAMERIRKNRERVQSVVFEFNESPAIPPGPPFYTPEVRARWVVASSLHVIDVALLPAGWPDPDRSRFLTAGSLPWHPGAAVFVGAGLTDDGVLFSYHANWCSPGPWSVEWVTPAARYIFRPLETLSVLTPGTSALREVEIDADLDRRFKPGVYLQDRDFLEGPGDGATLDDALRLLALGEAIGRYALPRT